MVTVCSPCPALYTAVPFCDKCTNCPQWDSILGFYALQSDMLPLGTATCKNRCTCFPQLNRMQYGAETLAVTGSRSTPAWMQTYITPDTAQTTEKPKQLSINAHCHVMSPYYVTHLRFCIILNFFRIVCLRGTSYSCFLFASFLTLVLTDVRSELRQISARYRAI